MKGIKDEYLVAGGVGISLLIFAIAIAVKKNNANSGANNSGTGSNSGGGTGGYDPGYVPPGPGTQGDSFADRQRKRDAVTAVYYNELAACDQLKRGLNIKKLFGKPGVRDVCRLDAKRRYDAEIVRIG